MLTKRLNSHPPCVPACLLFPWSMHCNGCQHARLLDTSHPVCVSNSGNADAQKPAGTGDCRNAELTISPPKFKAAPLDLFVFTMQRRWQMTNISGLACSHVVFLMARSKEEGVGMGHAHHLDPLPPRDWCLAQYP